MQDLALSEINQHQQKNLFLHVPEFRGIFDILRVHKSSPYMTSSVETFPPRISPFEAVSDLASTHGRRRQL